MPAGTEQRADMPHQEAALSPPPSSAELRQRIKAWTRAAWKASGKTQAVLSELMGQETNWLGLRISDATNVVLSRESMDTLSRLAGYALPQDVIAARDELISRRHMSRHALLGLQPSQGACRTAEDEMALLIDAAHQHITNGTADRNKAFMRLRFGVGTGKGATLAEVGERFSLTRERVRQIEAKMLSRLADAAETFPTPMLDAVVAKVRESVGLPFEVVEKELQPLLGQVPLKEALRFQQEIRPSDDDLGAESAVIYGQQRVRVVTNGTESASLAAVVSMGARKLFSHAGACLISDLRMYLEDAHGIAPMPTATLVNVVEALPGMQWLPGGKRWFWFPSEDLTPLLLRAAIIIGLAKEPVDLETLYAGMARDVRRRLDSDLAAYSDPIPPPSIVQSMLDGHPLFVRREARSHGLAMPFDPYIHLQGYQKAIAERLEAAGGAMHRADLIDGVARADGSLWSRDAIVLTLYLSPFIERIGRSVYALRGRVLSDAVRLAVFERSAAVDAEQGRSQRSGWDGSPVVADVAITETLKRNRFLMFRRGDIPAGIAGTYTREDGGQCRLIDDTHGIRLVSVGAGIVRAITEAECGQVLRFRFDVEQGQMQCEVVPAVSG